MRRTPLCLAVAAAAILVIVHTTPKQRSAWATAVPAASISTTIAAHADGAHRTTQHSPRAAASLENVGYDLGQANKYLQEAARSLGNGGRAEAIRDNGSPRKSAVSSTLGARAATTATPAASGVAPAAVSASLHSRAPPAHKSKPCAAGCSTHGTCNEEVGRCDCPPYMGGDDCSVPLFPSCVDQWGLKPPVAPCGIHTQPAFPSSCECVWECHSLAHDARQECVVDPKPGQSMEAAKADVKQRMGWMPVIANATWLARTKADAAASLKQGLCSGHGIFSVQLPYEFYPPDGEVKDGIKLRHTPLCRCFPGYTGPQCEVKMDGAAHLHKCLNDCSGRGTCVHNFCKCEAGTWGADCSLGGGSAELMGARAAKDVADGGGGRGGGAPSGSAPGGGGGGVRPRIYVYDVPPRFTSWLGAMRRGDWTRDHWYGVDVMLHQQLLRSKYRTLDPEEADYFFIPLHLSLGYYSHRYYFKHFTQPAHKPLRDVLAYVRATWPYFDRHGGKDHIVVMTQDQGNRFVRQSVPEAAPLIMIHHWGAPRSCIVDGSGQGDHLVGHDITVPPFHGEQARLNRWLPAKVKPGAEAIAKCRGGAATSAGCSEPEIRPTQLRATPQEADFKQLLFFSGKMNLNWGRAYALGVRQAVYRAHRNHSRFLIMTFDNGVFEKVPFERHVANYATSKFCLAPAGYGFSSRQYECVLVGCVPVIIQDDVEMAFEEVLPWHRFALRVRFEDIPILPQLLSRIPASHVARLRRGLGCIWPRMLWLAPNLYSQPGLDADPTVLAARPHDAFETTMRTLRLRLAARAAAADGGGGGSGSGGGGEPWRADVLSCVVEPGDDDAFDFEALRQQVRAEQPPLATDAKLVDEIIQQWKRTKDDKTFAMRTRFFPSGVKIPGVKWT